MSRPTGLLLLAGGFTLLVALVLLWRSTRADTTTSMHGETLAASPQPLTPRATTTVAGTRPAAAPTSAARPERQSAGMVSPLNPPTEETPAAAEQPDDTQNLQYGAKQLHAQTAAVEPLVRECVDKAVIAGQHPTGTAMLTYIVAKRGDKFTIETTGIDAEKTTLQQESLLECLHQTAKAMKFEGLPRNAQEIYAARTVTIENGKITEYKHTTFSYLR